MRPKGKLVIVLEFESTVDIDEHIFKSIKDSFLSTASAFGNASVVEVTRDFKKGRRNISVRVIYKINCNITGLVASLKTNSSKAVRRDIKHISEGIWIRGYNYVSAM